ncbi:MAG TPA: esterase, partial [Acinetobacter radioresistens]|nr:esterase [Acinetobacter radioresistens]
MKIDPIFKQFLAESLLKSLVRKPSQFALPLPVLRTAFNQLGRVFPKNPEVEIRALRLAGVRAEEIKPQPNATQMILHIHGGAFFLGGLATHRSFMTELAARTQMQVV